MKYHALNFKEKLSLFDEQWTLATLIDASVEIGFLRKNMKQFGHPLRYFRNYIYPRDKMEHKFNAIK